MRWRVRLFDGPLLESAAGEEVRRFRSKKVAAVLAYLALHLGKQVGREELAAAVWPEEYDEQVVANRLRVTLASLRKQLEPDGVPFGSVLDASMPGCVSLREESVWCDVIAGETSSGAFLPGFYEDWAVLERERLDAVADSLPPPSPAKKKTPEATRAEFPLPLYLTRYFGREDEIASLRNLIAQDRLITITGPGGMGKTRLAIETVRDIGGTVIFVPLADVPGPAQVPEAILQAFGITPAAGADLGEPIIAFLSKRPSVLLILDNAEHLVEPVADLALALLEAIPTLHLLVTSRQRLDIPGERVVPLSSLPFENEPTADAQTPSAALFLDRARNARPDFTLQPHHAPAVGQICGILEGMPFALELAAARVIAQTPSQILEALQTNLTDLKSRQRGLSARHQSLRASIQGSYDLLTPELKDFLARLSIFEGGWTPEAAGIITGSAETVAFLEDLTLRSLVSAHEDDGGNLRYRFLEPIRRFAADLLENRGPVAKLHAEYYLGLAASVSEDDADSLRPLDGEQLNLALALERAEPSELYWSALAGILTYGHVRGQHRTALRYAELVLARIGEVGPIETRVKLWTAAYYVFSYLGQMDRVRTLGAEMLRESEARDSLAGRVNAELILGYAAVQFYENVVAAGRVRRALAVARESGDPVLIWRSLRIAGFVLLRVEMETRPDPDFSECEALLTECLERLPERSTHIPFTQMTLSYALRRKGRDAESYFHLKAAQRVALEQGMPSMLLFSFREEADRALVAGHHEYAAQLYGAFLQMQEMTGYNSVESKSDEETPSEKLIGILGSEAYENLAGQGKKIPYAALAALSMPNR